MRPTVATLELFKLFKEYASDVPIIVVATKSDIFLDNRFGVAWRLTGKTPETAARASEQAQIELDKKVIKWREQIFETADVDLDGLIPVNQGK